MKTYLVIFLIILFCGVHTYVTLLLSNYTFDTRVIKLMIHVPLLIFSASLYASEYIGDNSIHSKRVQLIGKFIILVFLTLYCLNYLGLIEGVTRKLFYFYGINLVGLLMILISSYRHKLLNE